MENKTTYMRILEHDLDDQIRIGSAFHVSNITDTLDVIISSYEKKLEWCGGFAKGCNKFYKRLALVDAEDLTVIQMIYLKPNN